MTSLPFNKKMAELLYWKGIYIRDQWLHGCTDCTGSIISQAFIGLYKSLMNSCWNDTLLCQTTYEVLKIKWSLIVVLHRFTRLIPGVSGCHVRRLHQMATLIFVDLFNQMNVMFSQDHLLCCYEHTRWFSLGDMCHKIIILIFAH